MLLSRVSTLLFLLSICLSACHGDPKLTWVLDDSGHLKGLHLEQVKLPGLSYLSLGASQKETLAALRNHGFECNEEISTNHTQACIRPPGDEEPTGGTVLLEFEQSVLSGVQSEMMASGDDSGKLAQKLYDTLERNWTQAYGTSTMVRRPGITASRRRLKDGSALLLVRYDDEPTLVAEHLKLQTDKLEIPPPPGSSGTR